MAARRRAPKKQAGGRPEATGDCYEAAGKYILGLSHLYMSGKKVAGDVGAAEGLILVHAEVNGQGPLEGTTFGHGFVVDTETNFVIDKSNGRDIRMPKELYFAIGGIYDIDNYYEYTPQEMLKQMIAYMHWGPWDLKTRSGL
jgi:hypothetical protein